MAIIYQVLVIANRSRRKRLLFDRIAHSQQTAIIGEESAVRHVRPAAHGTMIA